MGEAYVVLLRVHLHFPVAGSLKAKRSELNSLKAALRTKLGASVAEVDHQDTWQRSTLAAAIAAGSPSAAEQSADRVERWLDARWPDAVRVERVVTGFEELP